jgi:hypothetical protein
VTQKTDGTPTRLGNVSVEAISSPNTAEGKKVAVLDVQSRAISSGIRGRDDPSPIQRLSAELLAEIFMFCVSDIKKSIGRFERNKRTPIYLCRVCRRWKDVAFDLPGLWTTLSLNMRNVKPWQRKILPDLLNQWFTRSRHLPLTFKFTGSPSEALEPLSGLILPYAHRLRHFDFPSPDFVCQVPTESHSASTSPVGDSSWSTLRFHELESAIIRDVISVYDDRDAPLFPYAPRLQRIRMDNLSFTGPRIRLVLPWSQLTHLVLRNSIETHIWYQIFPMCPNLQHGFFCIGQEDNNEAPPTSQPVDHVTFDHLVELSLMFGAYMDVRVFSPFDFPALVTLTLVADAEDFLDKECFWTETDRRRCHQQLASVQRLSLNGEWPYELLLEGMEQIVELDLRYQFENFDEEFLSYLRPDQDFILPNLKVLTLELDCDNSAESEANVIADIIKFRRSTKSSPEGGIEKLSVVANVSRATRIACTDTLMDKLQPYFSDGFRLEIKDVDSRSRRLDLMATEWHDGMIDI